MPSKKKNTSKIQITDSPQSDVYEPSNTHSEINELILQELREFKKFFKKEIREELKENRTEIQQDIHKEIERLAGKIDKINKDVDTIKIEVDGLHDKTKRMEENLEFLEIKIKQSEQAILFQENRLRQRGIKLRGVTEEKGEKLLERIIAQLAKFIDVAEDYLDSQVEKIFRVNSKVAFERKLARDF